MFALFSVSPESLPANGNDLAGELIKRSIFRQAEIEPSLRDSGGRGGGGGRRGGRGEGGGRGRSDELPRSSAPGRKVGGENARCWVVDVWPL